MSRSKLQYVDTWYDINEVKEVEITVNPGLYDGWRSDLKNIAQMSESKVEAILTKYISISVRYIGIDAKDSKPIRHGIFVEDDNIRSGKQPITIKGKDLHIIGDFSYGT
jgi:hypothetical protein